VGGNEGEDSKKRRGKEQKRRKKSGEQKVSGTREDKQIKIST
jgi:hypothetical protein